MTADNAALAGIDPNGALGYLLDKPKVTAPNNAMDKDAFLKLLVAQMKYQDPMDPAKSSDFVAQTAQFTVVESLEKMSAQNAELLSSQKSLSAAAFVGREITWQPPATDGTSQLPPVQKGVVTGMKLNSDGPILLIGDTQVAIGAVREVHTAPVIPVVPVGPGGPMAPLAPPITGNGAPGTTGHSDTTDDATPPTDGTSNDTPAAPAT